MMMARGRATAFKVWAAFGLAFVLAGCTGNGGPAAVLEPPRTAEFGDDTGALEGRVVDNELLPVVNAAVGLLQLERQTTTDEGGHFVFSDLPPGNYSLAVGAIGYDSSLRWVDVVAGEVRDVEVTLAAIIIHESHSKVWTDKGFFECSWQTPVGTGPCFFPAPQTPQPNNKRAWNYPVGPGLETLINEAVWTSNSLATGSALRMTFSYANRTTTHWYCDAEGDSGLQLHWDRSEGCVSGGNNLPDGQPEEVPIEGQVVRTFVNSGEGNVPLSVLGFGIAFQQSFEIWTTEFYWAKAPPGYTARN